MKHSLNSTTKKRICILGPVQFTILFKEFGIKIHYKTKGMGGTPVVNQILSLRDLDAKLSIISLTEELSNYEWIDIKNEAIDIFINKLGKNHNLRKFCIPEIILIRKKIMEIKPHLVISNYTVEYSLATLTLPYPSIIIVHDNPFRIIKVQRYHPYWIFRFFCSMLIYYIGKNFICVNNYVFKSSKLLSRNNTQIVSNPLPINIFSLYKPNRIKNAIKRNKIIIISIISWGELKNCKNGLQAFKIFNSLFPTSEYWLIGPGLECDGPAYKWASINGATQNVIFLGKKEYEQTILYLDMASILLHPSYEEAESMVISEAMTLGLPIVAGNESGGIPEQLGFGKRGILVNVHNPKSIVQGIELFLYGGLVRDRIVQAAYEYSLNNYHPKYFYTKINSIIEKLEI